jgi:radical SAM protein with 4Fe4S-binding SPASM domain
VPGARRSLEIWRSWKEKTTNMLLLDLLKPLRYVNKHTFSPKRLLNRIRVMTEYARGDLLTNSFPNMIHIELTNHCNLKCIMCPQPTIMQRTKGMMSLELFKKIIDELRHTPAEFVYLHQFGESLMNKSFYEMVKYAKKAGLHVGVSTNATLLNAERSEKLLETRLDFLTLSLDGGTQDLYNHFRPGVDWSKVEKNVFDFLELRRKKVKERWPHVVAQTISMKGNEDSLENLRQRFSRYNVSFTNKPYNEWGGKEEQIVSLSTNDNPTAGSGRQRCEKPYKLLTIEWDGTVVPCTRFYDNQYTYGKFPDKTLREIWNGDKAARFRKAHLGDRGKIDYCSTCICDGPSFLEQQAMKVMDIMWIEKAIMDIPFVRMRGIANVFAGLIPGRKRKKFQ